MGSTNPNIDIAKATILNYRDGRLGTNLSVVPKTEAYIQSDEINFFAPKEVWNQGDFLSSFSKEVEIRLNPEERSHQCPDVKGKGFHPSHRHRIIQCNKGE
jgi:hypothetical protein